MTEIETLTEEERGIVQRLAAGENDNVLMSVAQAVEKLLQAHDAQAERIAELEAECGRLTRDLVQRNGSLATLEAKEQRRNEVGLLRCTICGRTGDAEG